MGETNRCPECRYPWLPKSGNFGFGMLGAVQKSKCFDCLKYYTDPKYLWSTLLRKGLPNLVKRASDAGICNEHGLLILMRKGLVTTENIRTVDEWLIYIDCIIDACSELNLSDDDAEKISKFFDSYQPDDMHSVNAWQNLKQKAIGGGSGTKSARRKNAENFPCDKL